MLLLPAATSAVGEFEEYEGESEERRRARLKRQQKTHDRMVCVFLIF